MIVELPLWRGELILILRPGMTTPTMLSLLQCDGLISGEAGQCDASLDGDNLHTGYMSLLQA